MGCFNKLSLRHCQLVPVYGLFRLCRTYSQRNVNPAAYSGGGTKNIGMFSKLMSTASQFAMEGVKNLVVKKHVSDLSFQQSPSVNTLSGISEMNSPPTARAILICRIYRRRRLWTH